MPAVSQRPLRRTKRPHLPHNLETEDVTTADSLTAILVLWAIGISGFCALAYEVLWTRIMVFFLGSTTYAFATMLAAFLFGIALGSMVLARWVDRIKQPVAVFGIIQLGIGPIRAYSDASV